MTSALPSKGNANSTSPLVTRMFHEKMSRFAQFTSGALSWTTVTMKLIAPSVVAMPERWSPSRSVVICGFSVVDDSGVYSVHPTPGSSTDCSSASDSGGKKIPSSCAPTWKNSPARASRSAGGSSQNAMAFTRGNAMSSAPTNSGRK